MFAEARFIQYAPVRTTFLVVPLLLLSMRALGQSLYIAPAATEDDAIRWLIGEPNNRPLTLTLRGYARGDTDVIPLSKGSDRHMARRVYRGDAPYFDAYEVYDVDVYRGLWQLSYAWTRADLYQGNRDAAQTYLDSLSDTLANNSMGSPRATMNRTSAARWQIAYRSPVTIAQHHADLFVAANYFRMQRVQLGSLTGATSGEQFNGVLRFLSTLDMPPEETHSDGLGLDAGFALTVNRNWRLAVQYENLVSRVWQRGLQAITAQVATNTIVADSDGFLYGAPLLSGTTSRTNLQTELRRRFDLGAAYERNGVHWLAILHHDFDWRFAFGITGGTRAARRLWILLWPDPVEWQAGLDWGMLRVALGMSDLDPAASERATLSVALCIPLEPSRQHHLKNPAEDVP